jgi:hypothetical protein
MAVIVAGLPVVVAPFRVQAAAVGMYGRGQQRPENHGKRDDPVQSHDVLGGEDFLPIRGFDLHP